MTPARLLAAALLLVVTPATAQDVTYQEVDGRISVDAFGQHLVMPLPDWLGTPVPLAETEAYSEAANGEALLELRPKGQSEMDWRQLYWGRIVNEPTISLEQIRQVTFDGMVQNCKPGEYDAVPAWDDPAKGFPPLIFVCGAHAEGLGIDGLAEVAIIAFRKTDAGVALVTTEWRGPTFNVHDFKTWPIGPRALLDQAAKIDAAISFAPAD